MAGKGLETKQEAALAEFREAVACIPNKPEDNDQYYLRWLRARKYDVQKALLMFKNVRDEIVIIQWSPSVFYRGQGWICTTNCAFGTLRSALYRGVAFMRGSR